MVNANEEFEFETLWCKITTPNPEYYAASVYHPPHSIYEPADLLKFLSDTCDQILHDDPNAKIVIAGDINQLKIKDLMQQHGLHQMVKVPTRRDKILDVFLTNSPLLWKSGKVHERLDLLFQLNLNENMSVSVTQETTAKLLLIGILLTT